MTKPLDPDLFSTCSTDRLPLQIGDKWTTKILICLENGPRRFSEMQVPLHWVTPKVLTESLRSMQRDGPLTRTAYEDEVPRRVVYDLTLLGRSLFEPLQANCAWTRAHVDKLLAARARRPECLQHRHSSSGRWDVLASARRWTRLGPLDV